jgi:hypothetical protein
LVIYWDFRLVTAYRTDYFSGLSDQLSIYVFVDSYMRV